MHMVLIVQSGSCSLKAFVCRYLLLKENHQKNARQHFYSDKIPHTGIIWPGLKEFGPFMWQGEALAESAPCQLRLPQ